MDFGFETTPLWLAMEKEIAGLQDGDVGDSEKAVHTVAERLDESGYTVSTHAANMMALREAIAARIEVGHPLVTDFEQAIGALTLDDVHDTLKASVNVANDLGDTWPSMREYSRRADIQAVVEHTKLDLLVAEAKTRPGDKGIRFLLSEDVPHETVIDRLEVTQQQIDTVIAAIKAEQAAIAKVQELLAEVEGKPDVEQVRHLIDHDLPEETIIEVGGFSQASIDQVREMIAEEEREAARKAAEEAERKKAEAEGPPLEEIPKDELEEYVESIQEIMEFSDDPDEIRTMCEQSNIPKALVDIAVTDPDKLESLVE